MMTIDIEQYSINAKVWRIGPCMINSWNQPGQLWFGITYHANRNNNEPYSLLSFRQSFKLQFNSQLWGGLLCVPIVLYSYTISIYWLDGCESEWTPGVCNGQGGLACCDSRGLKELDTTEWLNWTELNWRVLETYNHHTNWKKQNKTAALQNYDKEEKMRRHCTVKKSPFEVDPGL